MDRLETFLETMKPGEIVGIFVTLLPALFFWFWRLSPDYGHSWMLVAVIPVLLMGVLICLGVNIFFMRRSANKGGWPFAIATNALTVLVAAFEFFVGNKS